MQKKWWHDKVAYQIYPKSFFDSNGDGIGDLRGITAKLDYLKMLGVDILWLSPVFCSPLADEGYDISDYYAIDPRFGTMEDMDQLIKEANQREMYIVMDLVVNHCSDEHEWFLNAVRDPDGKYGKYFYIEDRKGDKLPTNWRSYFGGSVWEPLPGHPDKYYMHLFHKKQPDLNWENKEVREEIYKMVNWWLDKGVSGFRIDAIINIKKAIPFRDYPADRNDGLSKIQNMLMDAKGIGAFLAELRDRTFALHDAFSVGEVFDVAERENPKFIGDEGYFSSMFDFSTAIIGRSDKGWYDCTEVTPEAYIRAVCASQEKMNGIGFWSNIIENHDEPRGVSRYLPEGQCTEMGKKMLALITLCLRGIPFIYQGQEIGMENMEFTSLDQMDDISTLVEYRVAKEAGFSDEEAFRIVSRHSRDNARTPMQWDDSENAGFTEGRPWLPVNPKKDKINVAAQLQSETSVLAFYKKLIALRKNPQYKNVLVYGDFQSCAIPEENLMAYLRTDGEKRLLIAANYQAEPKAVPLEWQVQKVILTNDTDLKMEDQTLYLNGYQAAVLEVGSV
jgi:oligo-1,6-glucosidase